MEMSDLIVTAPNGVRWKRSPETSSSAQELFAALKKLSELSTVEYQWNLWQKGRISQESERVWSTLAGWDHADPPPGGYPSTEEYKTRRDIKRAELEEERRTRAASYDQELSHARIRLLSEEATAGFMRNVLTAPTSQKQQEKAEELRESSEQKSAELRRQIGDPDSVVDDNGDLPPERRKQHLSEHMTFFRHELLRKLASGQRQRFNQLFAMHPPNSSDMCSECQAPKDWHNYGISLCLWRGSPEPGSMGEKIAALMPDWWGRCTACTNYQLQHQWGGSNALPDFGPEQWQAMLTPLLRAVFAPSKPAPRKPVDKRASLERRIRAAEAEAKRLRRELAKGKSRAIE